MKINIDREKCLGYGACVALYPEIFEMDDEFKARVKKGATDFRNIKEAVQSCPGQAISTEK